MSGALFNALVQVTQERLDAGRAVVKSLTPSQRRKIGRGERDHYLVPAAELERLVKAFEATVEATI